MNLTRRGLLTGLVALVAAPAIVRAESLMTLPVPVKLGDDNLISRLDVLYGYQYVRPEWTALVPDITLDKYSERILAPMVNRLAQNVADAVMYGNGASRVWLEADGTDLLPKGVREQVPVVAPIKLSDLLREARRATNSHE